MAFQVGLTVKREKGAELVSIVKDRRRFPGVKEIAHCKSRNKRTSYVLVTYKGGQVSASRTNRIVEKYRLLSQVSKVTVLGTPDELHAIMRNAAAHFFFDIDSTLTSGNAVIQNRAHNTIRKMIHDGHRIYLASGRHSEDVRIDTKSIGAERFGIAENGGILTTPSKDTLLGDRTEPDKVMHYMKRNRIGAREDIPSGIRLTERIYYNDMPEAEFIKHVKKSGAKIEVLASKTSYHVAKRGVNKGTALEKLRSDLMLSEHDIVVSVGDSDLDVPMFKVSDWSFAVNNASPRAKKSAKIVLDGDYSYGVAEMYDRWLASPDIR